MTDICDRCGEVSAKLKPQWWAGYERDIMLCADCWPERNPRSSAPNHDDEIDQARVTGGMPGDPLGTGGY